MRQAGACATNIAQLSWPSAAGHQTLVNPAPDFVIAVDDEALVVAEKLGKLMPVHAVDAERAAIDAAAAGVTPNATTGGASV